MQREKEVAVTSFMAKCEKCGAMIIPDTVCPNCHHSSRQIPATDEMAQDEQMLLQEYQRRSSRYFTNYLAYTVVMMMAGAAGLAAAVGWLLLIYRASLLGLILVAVGTPAAAILGWMVKAANRLFPRELVCPACNGRIEAMGLTEGHCPSCAARLQ
jgi:ribosomal protein L32